jgi:hypothetical protein
MSQRRRLERLERACPPIPAKPESVDGGLCLDLDEYRRLPVEERIQKFAKAMEEHYSQNAEHRLRMEQYRLLPLEERLRVLRQEIAAQR